jgi:outer membrane protein assembly factor BamA
MIASSKESSLLVPGDRYSLQTIKDERIRIDEFLKQQGYLYFNPEFILVQADTISEEYHVNLQILVKPDTPPESRKAYTIDKIYIHDDYGIENYQPDTLDQDPVFILSESKELNYRAFQNGLFIKPGQLYSQSEVSQTMRYLNKLPIIRSSSVKFIQGPQPDQLDAMLYISQRKRFAYTAEVNTIFRSTNYFGPGIIFSYTDRNVKHEANQLKVNLRGRFEVQVADGDVNPAWEMGVEVNYRLPRLYPAFLVRKQQKRIPQTFIATGYNLFNRLDLYRLNSIFYNLGYQWSKNDEITHQISPLEVIFTQIPETSISDEFQEYLENNPGVRRSFDEQFVLGAGYVFTYDPIPGDKGDFFFRGGFDIAGNLLYSTYSVFNAEKNDEGKYDLFGVPFSQYVRTSLDLRYEFFLNQNSSLVTRFASGIGIPYSNSEVLPYIRQFYVGGTNSMRSFIARSVGPGSEVPPEGFRDLTGDIRLEWNLEYRFTVAGNFKSALFVDAGNIWLYNDDPARPNGVFRFDKFLDELAISSGFGLRWDFEFVIARLDLAYTLRKPYLPKGERWNKDFNIWKPTFNIAIGYPF